VVIRINLGFVSLALKIGYNVGDMRESIEALSSKVGLVLLVLGGMSDRIATTNAWICVLEIREG
jgi:hypothetical protein